MGPCHCRAIKHHSQFVAHVNDLSLPMNEHATLPGSFPYSASFVDHLGCFTLHGITLYILKSITNSLIFRATVEGGYYHTTLPLNMPEPTEHTQPPSRRARPRVEFGWISHVGSGTWASGDGAERKLVVICFRVGKRTGEDGMISCVSWQPQAFCTPLMTHSLG